MDAIPLLGSVLQCPRMHRKPDHTKHAETSHILLIKTLNNLQYRMIYPH